MALVHVILPFNITHNAETDAIDMLMEVDRLPLLSQHINKDNFTRICQYVVAAANYMPSREEQKMMLGLAFHAYFAHEDYVHALRVAIRWVDVSSFLYFV